MPKTEYRDVFSKKINYYMALNGKTQADISKDLGYTRSAVSTWCVGTRIPRPEVVDSLAKYFGIKRSDLIDYRKGDEETEPIDSDGLKVLKAYNNNSMLKILIDNSLGLTDAQAKSLIDIVEHMKKTY